MNNLKKALALFLCMAMCLSMLPTWAVAEEGQDPEPEAVLLETEPAQEAANTVPENETEAEQAAVEAVTDSVQEDLPETEAEELSGEEFTEEQQAEPEDEEMGEDPKAQETQAEEREDGEKAQAVMVTFLLTPEETEITVYTKDEANGKTVIEAEEDGIYLLLPGEYYYDASAEGYLAVEEETLMVLPSEEPVKVEAVMTPADRQAAGAQTEAETEEAVLQAEETADLMASSGTCGPNLRWSLDDSGVLTISGSGKMTDYSIREGYYTTLAPWGEEYYNVKRVVINQGVTSIGDYAFHTCSEIASVSIPSSVTSIGVHAFFGCRGITSLTLPERGITSIGNEAFSGCSGLTAITIPKTVTTIGDRAFSSSGLTSIIIPDGVTSLGGALFMYCRQLKNATLPSNLNKISTQMFDGCTLLSGVTIPNSVTEIGYWAFKDCTRLASITIPSNVSKMLDAFVNCTGLNTVTFNGPCPRAMGTEVFSGVTATVYYYRGWTTSQMKNYGGNLTWISRGSGVSFIDVANPADYFYDPVYWAVENGITTGRTDTTFDPYGQCTRGHIVLFLWRAMGKQEPTISNPFTDVNPGDNFYKAVLWAYEKGITTGQTATTFGPWNFCTRGQIVTFLWRAMGTSEPTGSNPFTDVKQSDGFYRAVLWAVENGITTGRTKTTFDPWATCTRGQAVTFLYRAMN